MSSKKSVQISSQGSAKDKQDWEGYIDRDLTPYNSVVDQEGYDLGETGKFEEDNPTTPRNIVLNDPQVIQLSPKDGAAKLNLNVVRDQQFIGNYIHNVYTIYLCIYGCPIILR